MTSKSVALLLGSGALALAGAIAWLVARGGALDGVEADRPTVVEAWPVVPAELVRQRDKLELDSGESDFDRAARGMRSGRASGVEAPIPDALRSVRGRVLDVLSGEPLAGFQLQFLSRRPKNVVATTDAHGEFTTALELASGVVAVSHVPNVADPRYAGRFEIEPGEFLLPRAGDDAPAFPVELGARSPRRVFEVDVRRPDGTPAMEASVSLASGRRDAQGIFLAESRDFEIADLLGRARFALFGDDAFQDTYRLEAEQGGTLVAEPREFDPPLPTTLERLDLHPGAVLRVRVKNDDGRGVPGISLWLSTPDAGRFTSGRRGETDANGDHHFTGLREACWTVSAAHPFTGEVVERAIDLLPAEYVDVDLRLSIANLRLGAHGVVLDERGAPLAGVAVHVAAAGSPPVEIATDPAGRFEFHGLASGTLLLGFGGAFLDDLYEPGVLTVPFGATGLVVRRTERRVDRSVPIEVTSRVNGQRCARAVVWLARPESSALTGTSAIQRFSAPSGVALLALPRGEVARFAVDAPGFLRAEGELANLLAAAENGRPLRVELAPGFERRVEVRDRISRALLADAVFFASSGVLGATDRTGVTTLRAPAWPGSIRVECTGYAPLAWDPLAAGWPGTVVWMDPVSDR